MQELTNTGFPSYGALWAKSSPYHPLWKHLLDASAVSLALRNPLEGAGWSAQLVALFVGLHDIGKADACFQHQIPGPAVDLNNAGFAPSADARCRHERLSADFIRTQLVHAGTSSRDADTIARAALAHHGYWDEQPRPVGGSYAQAQTGLLNLIQSVLGLHSVSIPMIVDHSSLGMRLAGHIVLCDWIASNEEFYTDSSLKDISDPSAYFEAAKQVASTTIEQLGLRRNQAEGRPMAICASPRPVQQALLDNDIPPSLVIIEAPMGEGKTEAAWILAEKWRSFGYYGMYMALPTMATSDSLYKRYEVHYLNHLARGEDAKLVHGMAWLRDEIEPVGLREIGERGDDQSAAAAWFRPPRRAMIAAHGVGTVDQAMLAGMHVKFGFLRLYGLTDRVLVIDEVHAYDAYMGAIICRLLQWCACLKIPVILLSATLSAKQRAEMIEAYGATSGDLGPEAPYPLITIAEAGKAARVIEAKASSARVLQLETHPGLLGDAKETAAKAKELVKGGGCCCVILNTVKQAQAVYRELGNDVPKLLFHARFTAEDRKRIADKVNQLFGKDALNRPERFILVATQVVEQSLDVDFDHMITEIAPMDLLLQRSGRLHRHQARPDNPTLHVLLPATEKKGKAVSEPDFGASQKIYERFPLLSTLALLGKATEVNLPDQFRPLIEGVYGDSLPTDANDDMKKSRVEWDDLQEDLAAQAGEFLLCEPMEDEFDPVGADEVGDDSDSSNGWRARTRLGLEDVLVIPVDGSDLAELSNGDVSRDRVRALYLKGVKIPPHFWPPTALKGMPKPVLGNGKLRGVWLLPVSKRATGWEWKGLKPEGKEYMINYDSTVGLTHGGDK